MLTNDVVSFEQPDPGILTIESYIPLSKGEEAQTHTPIDKSLQKTFTVK